jgi:hypothetical protein
MLKFYFKPQMVQWCPEPIRILTESKWASRLWRVELLRFLTRLQGTSRVIQAQQILREEGNNTPILPFHKLRGNGGMVGTNSLSLWCRSRGIYEQLFTVVHLYVEDQFALHNEQLNFSGTPQVPYLQWSGLFGGHDT